MRTPKFAIITFAGLLLTGCLGGAQTSVTEAPQPTTVVTQHDLPLPAPGEGTVYDLKVDESQLRILIYRAGKLAHLGHNHVISAPLHGSLTLTDDLLRSSVNLHVNVDSFVIDDAQLRALEGDEFPGEIPDKDKRGTRKNMLGEKLLKAQQYPQITLRSHSLSGTLPNLVVHFHVDIAGQTQQLSLPANIKQSAQRIEASGEAIVSHEQLGLAPFSVFLGALRVESEMTFKYKLVADRR